MLLLLTGCAPDGDEAAHDFLREHDAATAITQGELDGPDWEGVTGATWHGVDLDVWLAPCAPVGELDTSFVIAPGEFPWDVDDDDLPACVRDRLSTFPFDPPPERGARARVRIHYAPGLPVVPTTTRAPQTPAPPYVVRAPDAVHLDPVRWQGGPAEPLVDAESWARKLTCPAASLDLVRVVIAPDGVRVTPDNDCVRRKAEAVETGDLLVLDVPVGPW